MRELTFMGGHRVATDAGIRYLIPGWRDVSGDGTADQRGENQFPACYTGGSFVRVSATFSVCGIEEGCSVRVVGLTTGALRFEATARVTGGRLFLTSVRSDRPLPAVVRSYNPFRIDWSVSPHGAARWLPAGATENRLYTTLADPQTKPLYETILDIGCRNADGQSEGPSVTAAIWEDFQKRNRDGTLPGVKRKAADGFNQRDGTVMRYWFDEGNRLNGKVSSCCHRLQDMLHPSPGDDSLNGVGTCQAWTELFEQVLRAQGIGAVETVAVNPSRVASAMGVGFLMKTRAFWSAAMGSKEFAAHGVPPGWGDPREIHGQGTPAPPTGYVNHSLVLVDGAYYDPSYGNGPFRGTTDAEAQRLWERATLAAFVVDRVSNGHTNRYAVPLFSPSQTLAESWSAMTLCKFSLVCAQ